MLTFFTILLVLFIVNGLLVFFSVNKIEKSTTLTTDLYVLHQDSKKEVKPKEKPTYNIYKKAM